MATGGGDGSPSSTRRAQSSGRSTTVSGTIRSTYEVEVSLLIGNSEIIRNNGKAKFFATSSESPGHALDKLESIGKQLLAEVNRMREAYAE